FQRSRDDKNGKGDRKCFRCGDPNHLIGECPKPPKDKNQRAFVGGSWSDNGEEDDEKAAHQVFASSPGEIVSWFLHARFNQVLQELQKFSAFVDSLLESIERFLNRFAYQPSETSINDPEPDDGSVDTPLVSPFPHSDNEEVLNELSEYENVGTLRRERIINSLDGDDLSQTAYTYLDPILKIT
ncbi:homeodomain-like protein, partial [Tanacetum coccineum]